MIVVAIVAALAIAIRLLRDRRGGGLLPLALVILGLAPFAFVAWSIAEISRRWLARPAVVRRTLTRLGIGDLARGRSLTVERINQGDMNAVLRVTIGGGERIVLKHLLRFGTLLAWVAREFGATREYPRSLGVLARAVREVRAASRMSRAGIAAPRRLAFSLRHRVVAMEWVEGDDLAAALGHDPSLAARLGTLLRAMHGVGIAMGDANPRNFAVDRAGRIVPFDLELTHLGPSATARKKGFDFAWAAAFLPDDESRARFHSAYGAPPAGTALAIRSAEAHLAKFAPLIDWFARRWSGRRALVTVECLQIEPTTRCNFTCGFCCGRAMAQSDLDVSLFLRTLDQFPSVRQIELQGEGEPLMHPRYFEMLAAARARGIAVSLVTNGSHFTDEAVDRLLAGGVEKLSVSLESADPARFREIRGGKLEKVVAGLARLMAERKRRGLDRPLVGFCVTLLKRTAGDLDGIFALYRRLGLDGGITAQPLQKMSAYAEVYDEATAADALEGREADYHLIAFYRRARKIQRERWAKGGFHAHLMSNWRPASRRCPWLERGLYVNREGTVTPCCMIKRDDHALGRIGDPIAPILAARDAMRAELADGKTPAACEGCEIARYAVMTPGAVIRRAAVVGLRVVRSVVTGIER